MPVYPHLKDSVENDYPQFKQTIKGVFFAPVELITVGAKFTFATGLQTGDVLTVVATSVYTNPSGATAVYTDTATATVS